MMVKHTHTDTAKKRERKREREGSTYVKKRVYVGYCILHRERRRKWKQLKIYKYFQKHSDGFFPEKERESMYFLTVSERTMDDTKIQKYKNTKVLMFSTAANHPRLTLRRLTGRCIRVVHVSVEPMSVRREAPDGEAVANELPST